MNRSQFVPQLCIQIQNFTKQQGKKGTIFHTDHGVLMLYFQNFCEKPKIFFFPPKAKSKTQLLL